MPRCGRGSEWSDEGEMEFVTATRAVVLACGVCLVLLGPGVARAEDRFAAVAPEELEIVKIAATDERAVARAPGGGLELVRVGDAIGSNGTVTEIAEGRVVIEDRVGKRVDTVIIRLAAGEQSVERISRIVEGQPGSVLPAPAGGMGGAAGQGAAAEGKRGSE